MTPDLRLWLRKRLALLLLLLPAICTLLPLVLIAPAGSARLIIFVVWLAIVGLAALIAWQTLRRLRRG